MKQIIQDALAEIRKTRLTKNYTMPSSNKFKLGSGHSIFHNIRNNVRVVGTDELQKLIYNIARHATVIHVSLSNAQVGFKGYGLSPDKVKAEGVFQFEGKDYKLRHGSVVIAAITSCTNTSNPSVMLGAGTSFDLYCALFLVIFTIF
jgi:hypothetical protein